MFFILRLDSNTQTLIYDAKFVLQLREDVLFLFVVLFDYEKYIYIFFNATIR